MMRWLKVQCSLPNPIASSRLIGRFQNLPCATRASLLQKFTSASVDNCDQQNNHKAILQSSSFRNKSHIRLHNIKHSSAATLHHHPQWVATTSDRLESYEPHPNYSRHNGYHDNRYGQTSSKKCLHLPHKLLYGQSRRGKKARCSNHYPSHMKRTFLDLNSSVITHGN